MLGTILFYREFSVLLARKMPSSRFGGARTLPRLRCWQLWAFVMAATSIIVESLTLPFCHMFATLLPAQSVQNKCWTESRPSNRCPPWTMASGKYWLWYKVGSTNPKLHSSHRLNLPASPITFLFTLIISHYWLFQTLKHECLGPDSSVNSHTRYKLCTNTQSCHLKWQPTFSFFVRQLAFSIQWNPVSGLSINKLISPAHSCAY